MQRISILIASDKLSGIEKETLKDFVDSIVGTYYLLGRIKDPGTSIFIS